MAHEQAPALSSLCRILASRKPKKPSKRKEDPCTAFYWFFKEHSIRIADSLKEPITSWPVRVEVQRVWKVLNALERKPYIEKAERVKQLKVGSVGDINDGGKKPAAKV